MASQDSDGSDDDFFGRNRPSGLSGHLDMDDDVGRDRLTISKGDATKGALAFLLMILLNVLVYAALVGIVLYVALLVLQHFGVLMIGLV